MNREQISAKLTSYWGKVTEAEKLPWLKGLRSDALAELRKQLPAINKLLHGLAPDLPSVSAQWIADHLSAAPIVQRAERILMDWRVLDSYQRPDEPPVFPLNLLDQVIAEVALPLWAARKYRQAVNDAATSLNKFAQDRLDRHDVSDKELMEQAFSSDPPKPDKPRLRCPGDHRLVHIRDQQNGARQIAAGAFLAIRNPAHHMTGDWNPTTAFHHLAILSQVAHYFHHWNVVKYTPPAPDLSALSNPEVLEALMKIRQQQRPAIPQKSASSGSTASPASTGTREGT